MLGTILHTLKLENVSLDAALRKFISVIKLPGESQKIDRIITLFAERYVACNPSGAHALDHEETACIIAFSLVMLNVDAHNDNIPLKKKMTQSQ